MSFAGRKRDSKIWKVFEYNESINKNLCLTEISEGKVCGLRLAVERIFSLWGWLGLRAGCGNRPKITAVE